MEWELKKRSEEKSELQKIITQLKTNLFDERQGKLTLSKEMEYLRKKQGDDGKKIKYLQSVCQPIEEQVILQKDQKPSNSLPRSLPPCSLLPSLAAHASWPRRDRRASARACGSMRLLGLTPLH